MTIIVEYMTIIDTRTKTSDYWIYDDYCIQEQKLEYMTIILYKNKS